MRPSLLIAALFAGVEAAAAAIIPKASDSLQLDQSTASSISFDYSVSSPDKTNWIALYKPENSPTQNKYSYSAWTGAPKDAGTAFVDVSSLQSGSYEAYLLAKNVYTVLAGPVSVTVGSSSLTVDKNADPVTFDYTTNAPDSTNWIAIYTGDNSPTNNMYSYSAWVGAPSSSGSARIDPTAADEGEYRAYLLAKNGYDILAGPTTVHMPSHPLNSTIVNNPNAKPFTITYKTSEPDNTNWIAVYPPNTTVPDNVSYLAYSFAPGSSGTVTIDTTPLAPGDYDVFFLGHNRYKPIADKLTLTYTGDSGPVSFIVHNFTTINARQGDAFSANIAGLINPRAEVPSFKIISQCKGSWATIDATGTIHGTPTAGTGIATLRIQATIKDGTTDTLTVKIPLVAKNEPLVTQLKFMTMNLWVGGTQVKDYHRKQVRFFVDTNVDVIALTETAQVAGQRLAKALGWYGHHTSDTSVISRYPITSKPGTDFSTEAVVSLDGQDSSVIVWSAHLGYTPYGPYDFCQSHMTIDQVLQREADSGRTPQIIDIVNNIKPQLSNADKVPVLLAGDFNAPSHLDWTDASRSLHCNIGYVPWPTSKHPVDAGMVDSYRELYPDPVKNPADTWSPVHPAPAEPQDRLDFIYYHGGLKPVDSKPIMVGTPKPAPNTSNNEWTSDHMAFITTFEVLASARREI